ncbi:MAG TPA: ABC transporter permease [Candidatus Saccharimonadales bacterium]|nr:ABC transporter permease [Candidatus Saccharimonadales bacterium]
MGDLLRFTYGVLAGFRLRVVLTLLAMMIGVAAVIVLTGLGEGARLYVMDQFAGLGSHLLIVLPGRTETVGAAPPLLGETPRDLTVEDALALLRNADVRRVAPIQLGAATVSHGGRGREITVIGTTSEMRPIRHIKMGGGIFLPPAGAGVQMPVAVIGATVRKEIFGETSPLGQWIRVGDRRFRVIGVVRSSGSSIGLNLDEMVVIPVASAQSLFDTYSLFRILVEARSREAIPRAREAVIETMKRRHEGEDDVTVITQDALLSTFDRVLRALTLAVGGIAAISLAVAGVLVMNVMLVAVSERTAEIGLLKALGATRGRILVFFLTEAAALSLVGGVAGILAGYGAAGVVGWIYPALPIVPPSWAVAAAMLTAAATGLLFGYLPARRAAAMDPVLALAHA